MKIVLTADWHLGHGKTRAGTTVASLRKHLFPRLAEVDLLVVAGDLFDNSLVLSTVSTREALSFIMELLIEIKNLNLKTLILQGTTLHDRNQIHVIGDFAAQVGVSHLIRIVEKPSIVEIAGSSFLCLPDDLPFSSKEDLFKFVNKLLLQQPDGKVDYCVLHGMFDFACPGADHSDSFTVADFEDIVRFRVLCGHVHRPWENGIALYAGSTDRLCQNEEHPKGFWMLDGCEATFVENPDAVKYLTFEYTTTDLQELCDSHDRNMKRYFGDVEYGYCRVILDETDLRQSLRKYHQTKYPVVHFKCKPVRRDVIKDADEVEAREEVVLETPTTGNLAKLIAKNINEPEISVDDVQEVLTSLH